MSTLSTLVVRVASDLTSFSSGMTKVRSDTDKTGAQASSNLSRITDTFGKVGKGAMALGGTMTLAGAGLTALSEPLERSQVNLEQIIKNTGHSFDEYKTPIMNAVAAQEKFGHSQADTEDALGKLTAAFQDPKKALAEMTTVQELAAFKHISLADAAQLDIKMHAGAGRTFKEFGINVTDGTKAIKAAVTAEAADKSASEALAKAKQKLADVHAELKGKTKLTVSEQIRLRDSTQAVKDATEKASAAHVASVAAQDAAKNATAGYDQIINEKLLPRLKGLSAAQSDTFGGKLLAAKTRIQDFAANIGTNLGPALITAGPLLVGFGGAMQGLGPIAQAAAKLNMISAAQTLGGWIASAAGAIASFVAMAAGAVINAAIVAVAWLIAFWPIVLAIGAVILIGYLLITHWKQVSAVAGAVWKAVSGFFVNMWHDVVGAVGAIVGWIKSNWPLLLAILTGPIGLAVLFIATHFAQIKSFATNLWHDVTGIFRSLGTDIQNIWNGIIGKITGAWTGLIGAAGRIFGQIGGAIKNAISSIHIPLPHISAGKASSVQVGPLSVPVPNFSINWYKEGGLFTKPSIIGVGEAGDEAVIGKNRLERFLGDAASKDSRPNQGSTTSQDSELLRDIRGHLANLVEMGAEPIDQARLQNALYRLFSDISYKRTRNAVGAF